MQNLWEYRDFLFDELSKTQDWEQKSLHQNLHHFAVNLCEDM